MKIYVVTVDENEITVSLNGEAAVTKTVKPTITALANRNFRFECDGIDEEVESYLDIFINGQPLKGSWLSDEEWLSVALFDAIMNKTFTSGAASPGGSSYLVAEKILTHDEIIHLPTIPVELIAAPGSGKAIIPLSVVLLLKGYVADYTSIDANAAIQITQDGGGTVIMSQLRQPVQNSVSGLLAWGNDAVAILLANQNSISNDFIYGVSGYDAPDINDEPLKIEMNNGITGILAGGDSSTTLKVTVCYLVLDL